MFPPTPQRAKDESEERARAFQRQRKKKAKQQRAGGGGVATEADPALAHHGLARAALPPHQVEGRGW